MSSIPELQKQYEETTFEVGETVFIYFMSHMYPGSVVEKEKNETGGWKYLAHYDAWAKRFDEWLTPVRLRKNTPENIEAHRIQTTKPSSSSHKRQRDDTTSSCRKQSALEFVAQTPCKISDIAHIAEQHVVSSTATTKSATTVLAPVDVSQKKIIELPIPVALKKKLVDDSEWINNQRLVIPLPRDPTLNTILDEYLTSINCPNLSAPFSGNEHTANVRTMQSFFNLTIGDLLLYPVEKSASKSKVRNPGEHYGVEHLLRFLYRLPQLLGVMNAENDVCTSLVDEAAALLKYVDTRRAELFLTSYDASTTSSTKPTKK